MIESAHPHRTGLVRAFVFGVCLLTVVRAPTAMSAPTSYRERDVQEDSIPKWTVPCGQMLQENSSGSDSFFESDRDIAMPIVTAAKIALDHMYSFRENYTEETFHVKYSEHLVNTRHNTYDWLPKDIGKSSEPHLKSKKLEYYLKLYYVAMQKYAVGIEQVVKDQMQMKGLFREQLNATEGYLRNVLCELSSGLFSKGIIPPNEVDRNIMDDTTRNLVETAHRNLRDWTIIKEYIKGLEYLLENLEPFEGNQPS